jgi:hypothetical protein
MEILPLGIRHHGPGSSRSLVHLLESWQPDALVIELPPEAEALFAELPTAELEPPVAQLFYRTDAPSQAIYLPYTVYSPEWQAVGYAQRQGLPIHGFDLPMSLQLGTAFDQPPAEATAGTDPLRQLAHLAGYDDFEPWWNRLIEENRTPGQAFEAIAACMQALREGQTEPSVHTRTREAWMRTTLRNLDGRYPRVAVVCGAWHLPAIDRSRWAAEHKADKQLIKACTKAKIEGVWVPWSYQRLSLDSGYGAGIRAPMWYEHLWQHPEESENHWLVRAAGLLRTKGYDISTAHVIEALNLARSLAYLRGYAAPGLSDLEQAIEAVWLKGSSTPLGYVRQELITGHVYGHVAGTRLQPPLVLEFFQVLKQLKWTKLHEASRAQQQTITLDLRTPLDVQRSRWLYRWLLLGLHWATRAEDSDKYRRGSFAETWHLKWEADHTFDLIKASLHGSTFAEALPASIRHSLHPETPLAERVQLLGHALRADLPELVDELLTYVEEQSVTEGSIFELIPILPLLVVQVRYESIRVQDRDRLGLLVHYLVNLALARFTGHCLQLDRPGAENAIHQLNTLTFVLRQLRDAAQATRWYRTVLELTRAPFHALLRGKASQLVYTQAPALIPLVEVIGQELSPTQPPEEVCHWLEGYLWDGASTLLTERAVAQLFTTWLTALPQDAFHNLLPMLRRATSRLPAEQKPRLLDYLTQPPGTPDADTATPAYGPLDEHRIALLKPMFERYLTRTR